MSNNNHSENTFEKDEQFFRIGFEILAPDYVQSLKVNHDDDSKDKISIKNVTSRVE